MSDVDPMSFASSYVLASKVRSKLTKQASNPASSLRQLVLQANMLDNIMDHISSKTEEMKAENNVTFSKPNVISHARDASMEQNIGPNITEYEVDSDSDSDSDYEFDSDSDLEENTVEFSSDGDEDEYYLSSDSEDESLRFEDIPSLSFARKNTMPVIDLSDNHQLLVIYEEHEDSLPDLTHLISSSDSDSEDDIDMPNYVLPTRHGNGSTDSLLGAGAVAKEKLNPLAHMRHHHERHNAICSIENVF